MKNFALIGVAGYVAPRHLKAIKSTGNNLSAALDPFDSVGIIDQYFPDADFFVEFERFDRHIEKLKRKGMPVDYVSVCSPNYLHDSHIRFGLRNNADVICEKPVVLNPWNIDALQEIEKETGRNVCSILQLRLHPSIIKLKEKILAGSQDKIYDIDLTYITCRGHWYYASWKGDAAKSGGIATNIGIHFFDLLTWIFGEVCSNSVHVNKHDRAAGYLELKKARIRWFLSINEDALPAPVRNVGKNSYRLLRVDTEEIDFTDGFNDLHTMSYNSILSGNGFSLGECKSTIEIVHDIRHANAIGLKGNYHPFAALPDSKHPFS